jgi:pimeloyl-ACP methyl ester carboxylesterase
MENERGAGQRERGFVTVGLVETLLFAALIAVAAAVGVVFLAYKITLSRAYDAEPLSLRPSGIKVDSNAELRELPLEEINTPTLIISARDDLFNTLPAARFAAGKIRGAEMNVYEKGGHLLVGHAQDVRTKIRASGSLRSYRHAKIDSQVGNRQNAPAVCTERMSRPDRHRTT